MQVYYAAGYYFHFLAPPLHPSGGHRILYLFIAAAVSLFYLLCTRQRYFSYVEQGI